jgi:hypothetical protein
VETSRGPLMNERLLIAVLHLAVRHGAIAENRDVATFAAASVSEAQT